ncbi:MAG: GNAT family N-acetyltransferase [Acidobacteriota bacterium]|nr:GNAT family N-acetyltransferase [Acidobacteriota bacterium]
MKAKILETERLRLRKLTTGDAAFILRLLNEPSFMENIGDKGVRTLEDARNYIVNGPVASYERFGFGLFCVEEKASGAAIGMCGLLKRDALDDVDLGYALLPEFCSKGYAVESAAGVMRFANHTLGLNRVVAITSPDNQRSIRVLEKLSFRFDKRIRLSADAEELNLFVCELR